MTNGWGEPLLAAIARIAAPAMGVLLGTAAKYGEMLKNGTPMTWRSILGDLLQLGLIAVMAIAISEALHLHGTNASVAGAMTAVTSQRLIRIAREHFEKRFKAALDVVSGGE
jgi:hypothetical protein